MTLAELNDNFALPGVLAFEEAHGLIRAQVSLPSGTATVYLHGAHLTSWVPAGQPPVLYLSPKSDFLPGKAIRGGIPVCFPWFGPDTKNRAAGPDGKAKPGPSHGFARTQAWDVAFAALAGQALHLTFTLGPNDVSRQYGFDHFRVAYEMIFADTLTLRLSVANLGTEPLEIEEALHTYFAVSGPANCQITGLESATFLDKTDSMQQKTGPSGPLVLTQWTDRVYPANSATVHIADQTEARSITIAKQNSNTTVVWNPYPEASNGVNDLAEDSWQHFLCVETANTGTDAITLAPNQAHTMQAVISVTPA